MSAFYYPDANTLVYGGKTRFPETRSWLLSAPVFTSDLCEYECLTSWPGKNSPQYADERTYLTRFFQLARAENRYIQTNWTAPGNEYELRANELTAFGLKTRDACHAAVAERHGLIFVSSDKRLNRALSYLKSEHLFSAGLLTFSHENAEEVFARLNREKGL